MLVISTPPLLLIWCSTLHLTLLKQRQRPEQRIKPLLLLMAVVLLLVTYSLFRQSVRGR